MDYLRLRSCVLMEIEGLNIQRAIEHTVDMKLFF